MSNFNLKQQIKEYIYDLPEHSLIDFYKEFFEKDYKESGDITSGNYNHEYSLPDDVFYRLKEHIRITKILFEATIDKINPTDILQIESFLWMKAKTIIEKLIEENDKKQKHALYGKVLED